MRIDINVAKEQLTVPRRGMPVWVIYRDQAMMDTLTNTKLSDVLRDPYRQMATGYCKNIIVPSNQNFLSPLEFAHLACSPYRPDVGVLPRLAGWFYCPCHGSKYDLSGRVYQNVPAPLNLKIPRHMYLSDSEIVIGEDKDGVQGAISIS